MMGDGLAGGKFIASRITRFAGVHVRRAGRHHDFLGRTSFRVVVLTFFYMADKIVQNLAPPSSYF